MAIVICFNMRCKIKICLLSNKVYNTDALRKSLREHYMKKEVASHDVVIISQGTNDIWKEKLDNQGAFRNIIKAAEDIHKITNKPVLCRGERY